MSHYLLLVVLGSEVLIFQHMNTHQGRTPVLPEVDQVWAALYEKRKNNTDNTQQQQQQQQQQHSVCLVLTSPFISSGHLLVTDDGRSWNEAH